MKKRILALMLAVVTVVSMVGCNSKKKDDNSTTKAPTTQDDSSDKKDDDKVTIDLAGKDHDGRSEAIYDALLGEFYEYYQKAYDAESESEKWALMAIAEAKLMESAVMVPTTSNGGMYAISRAVPYTADYQLWGNDSYRYYTMLVVTEPLASEDRTEMKAKWNEVKGTGTYYEWAKGYLAEKGYTLKDTYTLGYSSDPENWDVLATSMAVDSEVLVNTYDGLMEYDNEGVLQPALAESYEVSDDGLTYTFHLRDDATWVDSQGRKIADVVADDFVAGFRHMLDAQGGLEYLVEGIVKGASEYIYGDTIDFGDVGVKAVDDYTVEYTLEAPCSYFLTMLGYGVFAPMSETYYKSQGGVFGVEELAGVGADYVYGTDKDHIAYCGPYLVTNATAENTIRFEANDTYYKKDKVALKTIVWAFNDGTEPTKAYEDMKAGTLDGCTVNTNVLELARSEKVPGEDITWFDKYSYTSSTDATSFMIFYNLNRSAFANFNDETVAVSAQTEEDAAKTNAAMLNTHFRLALSFAFDRGAYNAQASGEELKYTSLRNSYTPGNFIQLEEAVTVEINGKETTFPAGTNYGEIMQAQADADGFKATLYSADADEGNGSSDGYDGWFNAANAVEELNKAIAQLAEDGITIDEENPVIIDLPYPSNNTMYTNMANVYKQSIEKVLGGKVVMNLVACESWMEWYYATYYFGDGSEANYDLNNDSGWGPDYGDPSTYLDTFLPDGAGYMSRCVGLW